MEAGTEFPPLLVTFDGADYWLVDGFHRRWAAVRGGIDKLKCIVVQGTREDARWLSYSVNQDHGLPRSGEDKKKAVIAALKHPKGVKKSDRQIAEHVGVSHATVLKYRGQMESTGQIDQSPERTGKDGRTINTANIGKPKPQPTIIEELWQADEPDEEDEPQVVPPPPGDKRPQLQRMIDDHDQKVTIARWLFDSCNESQRAQISVAWSEWWKDE